MASPASHHDLESLPYRPCVGIMLINAQGHIFVGQRIDNTAEAWQMPQGGIDEGEQPLDAALRELQEETGVTADQVRQIAASEGWLSYDLPEALIPKLWGGKYRGQQQKWYLFELLAGDDAININTGEPEFRAWRWVTLQQLPTLIVPFKRALYEQLVTEFCDKIERHLSHNRR